MSLSNDAPPEVHAPAPAGHNVPSQHRGKPPRLPRYVTRRKPSGALMYVRRIPADIVAAGVHPPKQVAIRVCLSTRDWLAAQPKANQLTASLETLWAQTRQRLAMTAPTGPVSNPRQLMADDVPVLARRLEALLLHSDDLDRAGTLADEAYDQYEQELEDQRKALRRANQRADYGSVQEEAAGFLQAEGLECDEKSPEWASWLKSVLQAHLSALSGIAGRLDSQTVATPAAPPPIRSENDLDDIDRALVYWQEKTSPQDKTVVEMRAMVKRFKESTSRTRISAVQPDDILNFMRTERSRDSARGGKVNVQTVNKGLALLKALFSLVHADYLRQFNVANPLAEARKFKVKPKDVARRKFFTQEHLNTLFSGPVHTLHERSVGGAGEAAYWVPVLGYATGARMHELLQLRVADVVVVEGVTLLRTETELDEHDESADATDDGSSQAEESRPKRSLKTSESYRFIPVHSDVLALGFNEYVQWLRENNHAQLFPDVRPGIYDSWSANFSRYFNRYLKQRGIKQRLLDFVSFRHGFKTQTRSISGVKQDIADYIQGHARERASQGYGEFPAAALQASIEMMTFPALAKCKRWTPPRRRSVRRGDAPGGLRAE
jgi:integrase